MNYLAHLSLSHFDNEVMLGNLIGDSVKGDDYNRYSPRVRRGLLLHRQIDSFTDTHLLTQEAAALFYPSYRHYSGIIIDMVFDHFLAANWDLIFPQIELSKFVDQIHKNLLLNYFRLPGEFKKILPFLIKSRRLESYASMAGLARALNIMSKNTSLPSKTSLAIDCLSDNYDQLSVIFFEFFAQISSMVDDELADVQSPYTSAAVTIRSLSMKSLMTVTSE